MESSRIATQHAADVRRGERFRFGENWTRFVASLSEERIRQAESSLREMLGVQDLKGRRFLDIGSGSGLFSLAARRLGATVHSFDYDPQSVACTEGLRRRFFPDDPEWTVEEGSALDAEYLRRLGKFEIVYSWGVLHHTGQMWTALENATLPLAEGGTLFISIYNDMGPESARWRRIKRNYCRLPHVLRTPYAVLVMLPHEARHAGRSLLDGRPLDYVRSWTRYSGMRGMSRWHDIIDWVGGYPYEYASVEVILDFYRKRDFVPVKVKQGLGIGCSEFVLRHRPAGVG
jgi:2-polyprenyl-6-hydroxyphenyl methylase/3-demethylubiquinone-9 3-methyltransferase